VYYYYGDNVYYQDNMVYYGDEPVYTTDEYAEQALNIASEVPEEIPDETEWMSLGVFALTPDGTAEGVAPTIFLQLAVSRDGIIAGTVHNSETEQTEAVEGMVDEDSQRTAWVISGRTSPIMETGIYNLTNDEAPALLHFEDGQTQQWLLVRLEDPEASGEQG
jgi:hypothetical protein